MDPMDMRIADLAALHDIARQADKLPTYHQIADALSHRAWQLDAFVDNDESLNNEREEIVTLIGRWLDMGEAQELDDHDRTRITGSLTRIYTEAAEAHIRYEYMDEVDAREAIPEAVAFLIDSTEALWREAQR